METGRITQRRSMFKVIGFLALALLGAAAVIAWLNSDWIAPGGWISWLKCRFRR
jgi:hypothetical protein